MSAPLIEVLRAMDDRLSFHMPGHKGREGILPLRAHMDVTELNVTDDLYHAEGPILAAQRLMAKSARAAHTIFLTNGSTCGVEAMLGYAAAPGERVILPRASHLSAISACALYGMEPVWVDAWADEAGAPFTRTEDVLSAVRQNPDARAVLLTRPDYFGRMMELGQIAKAAHAAGMLVLVDEAHGAHLNWLDGLKCVYRPDDGAGRECVSALNMGADMCVQSAHKTLPALTGGAFLHMNERVDADRLLSRVALTQSSSPSFLIMASLDSAREYMDEHGCTELSRVADECERVLDECRTLDIMPAREYFGLDCDRTRIALDVTPRGITGFAARDALTRMGIDIEMADARRIVMICSAVDDKDKFDALIDGLKRLPRGNGNYALPKVERVMRGRRAMSVRQAALGAYERVELERAAGRIAARALGAYPPGVAECAPGEEISREICERLLAAQRAGAELFGLERGLCVVTRE